MNDVNPLAFSKRSGAWDCKRIKREGSRTGDAHLFPDRPLSGSLNKTVYIETFLIDSSLLLMYKEQQVIAI